MTNKGNDIIGRWNARIGAEVTIGGDKGYIIDAGNIFCKVLIQGCKVDYAYHELNENTEFSFEK